MPERTALLLRLIDDDVVKEIKNRLGTAGVADLVLEIVNPRVPLSTEQEAKLAGVSPRTARRRRAQGS